MSAPFLKKTKDGFSVKLNKALYPAAALEAFQSDMPDADFSGAGSYWSLRLAGHDEALALSALERLVCLSRRKLLK